MSSYGEYETGVEPPVASQLMKSGGIVAISVILLFLVEVLVMSSNSVSTKYRTIVDYTANSEDASIVVHQDVAKYPNAVPIGLSVNERTGTEFAYSLYLNVAASTFSGDAVYKHVFHKGYSCPWPFMGPGVFIRGDTNTMRVFMNTYQNPYTYVDINNIPVGKWFHLVLNAYKGGLDVFVNGSLANRISFKNSVPYQNFGELILFSNANYSYRGSQVPALNGEDFLVRGTFKGQLSNLVYARYALSVGEIQRLLENGPSSKAKISVEQKPPYLADDWWAQQI